MSGKIASLFGQSGMSAIDISHLGFRPIQKMLPSTPVRGSFGEPRLRKITSDACPSKSRRDQRGIRVCSLWATK